MNRIERYLGMTLISHTLLVWMVLLAMLVFSEFMVQLDDVSATFTMQKVLLYVALKTPGMAYQLFPIALLIGTLMGLGSLANFNELTILRVTGWSLQRIFLALLKTAFLIWLVVAVLGEWMVPTAESYATKMRAESLNKSLSIGGGSGVWVKEQERFIKIGSVQNDHTLRNVQVFEFSDNQMQLMGNASLVQYEAGQWVASNYQSTVLSSHIPSEFYQANGLTRVFDVEKQSLDKQVVPLALSPEDIAKLEIKSKYLGLFDLYSHIQFLKQNGINEPIYELEMAKKLASPLVILAMLAIVFPLIFGSQRQVSMGQRIFFGVLIGLTFHLVNQFLGNLTLVYDLSVYVGAFTPAIILIVVAAVLMKRNAS